MEQQEDNEGSESEKNSRSMSSAKGDDKELDSRIDIDEPKDY